MLSFGGQINKREETNNISCLVNRFYFDVWTRQESKDISRLLFVKIGGWTIEAKHAPTGMGKVKGNIIIITRGYEAVEPRMTVQ
jgi:hypothetical protein